MYLHQRITSSRLVVLLQQWAREDGERVAHPRGQEAPTPDVAEQLSQWLGTVDAVTLSRALHAIESLPPGTCEAGPHGLTLDVAALDRGVETAKADLTALITAQSAAPKPARARADNTPVSAPDPLAGAEFSAYGPRYLDLQRQIETRLAALRAQARQALGQGAHALRQLAALDAVMEQMLAAREQRLWAALPGYLEQRHAYREHRHQQTLQRSGTADEPLRWRQPGGWLWAFEQDLQALLLAEMQVRLQPITGLLEAAQNEKTGQAE